MIRLASIGPAGKERPVWITQDGKTFAETGAKSWRAVLDENSFDKLLAAAPPDGDSAWKDVGERFGPPIPNPSKVIAIGLNYHDHATEQGKKPPDSPLLFAKAPGCLIGAGDPIKLPQQEGRPDAEAELMIVIARKTSKVPVSKAADSILGYTIFNDVSGRDAQYGDRQWFRGKSYDTFGPCGPWIVLATDVGDPHKLPIRSSWNDAEMQSSTTANLIFNAFDLVSYISHQMTLMPGDLIATGTPAGVGVFRDPPVFLKPGDKVRIEIDGIGALENPVEAG